MLTSLRNAVYMAGFFICIKANSQQRDTTGTMEPARDSATSVTDKKQLKAVVVTATKTRYIDYQVDKIVVDPNAVIATAGGTIIDVLNTAPGVMVDENGGISLKGREGVMVYINDRPVHLAGTDLINYLRSLPVSTIEQIELMSNPSSRYNADGTAVINIRMKKIRSRGFNGSGRLGAGSSKYFTSNSSLLLNYRHNNFNIYFNGGYSVNNGFFISHRERVYSYPSNSLSYMLLQEVNETNREPAGNYNLGIDYNVSKRTTVGVLYNGFVESYREKGRYSNRFIGSSNKQDSFIISDSRMGRRSSRNAVNMNIQHFLMGSRREININLDYLHYETRLNQQLESILYKPVDSLVKQYALITESPFTAAIYGAKINYNDTLFHTIKWEQGIQTIYSERNNTSNYFNQSGNDLDPDPVLNNRFRYRESFHAAYITLQRNFKRFSAQAGLRLESTAGNALQYDMAAKPDTSFSLHYTNLFPTAFLLYKLDSNGKNILLFSAGKRIERPGYNELNPAAFYFDRNTSNVGNSLLQPAFSTNWELSYTHNKNFTTGISYNKTRGFITRGFKQVNDAFISTIVNVEQFTTFNVSINWSLNITRWWLVSINPEIINRHFRGAIFDEGLYANENLTTFFLKTYHKFNFSNGWSADLTAIYRSKFLLWQSSFRPVAQMHAGVQKKLNEKATVTIAATDIFNTWKTRRDTKIQYAQVYYKLVRDSQKIMATFSWRFGKGFNSRERKTGIEAEAGRVH
jgi:iron complex outermembrane recepter protein